MEIIGVIVAGIIIGLLGNIVALSTRNNLPLWLTIICGLSGAIIGWFSYYSRFVNHTSGIDWIRWLITVAAAAILMVIAAIVARSRANGYPAKATALSTWINLPLWLTIICCLSGTVIGEFSYASRFVNHTSGIDWIRWLITVVAAGILLVIANAIVARRSANGDPAKATALSTRVNLPLWLTIICGLSGDIIGEFSYYSRFVNKTPGIDWIRWLITVVAAAILVVIANAIVARSRAKREAEEQAEEHAQREAQEWGTRETGVQLPQLREPKIFLCYRRKDTEGFARSIYNKLADKYGHEQVYRDIDGTPAGVKYSTWIESMVRQCSVMVVLIGNAWISAQDRTGQRRLDSPKDWVRHEIKAALKRDIPIIPVLLQRAPMPSEEELPPSIAGLAGFQSAEITDTRWDYDVGQLIQAIDDLIAPV